MANRMFQYIIAKELQSRSGRPIPICGYKLPDWGMEGPRSPKWDLPRPRRMMMLVGQKFDLGLAAQLLGSGEVDVAIVEGWGMRMENLPDPATVATLFPVPDIDFHRVADDEILLHVRADDILTGFHPDYFPMPVAWYRKVIAQSGLQPAFIGELYAGPYLDCLERHFPEARFLAQAGPLADFHTLRHARHAGLSTSTFSWLATWMSDRSQTVHLPVCGLFKPTLQSGMLLPASDPRYRFYQLAIPPPEARPGLDLLAWLETEQPVPELSQAKAEELVRRAITGS